MLTSTDARPKQSLEYGLNIRVLAANETTTPPKYSWIRVYRDTKGVWNNLTESGNYTYDPAYDFGGGSLTVNSVYAAEREPRTGQLLATYGGGGGTSTVSNPIIMILGPWADYQNCPGVPPKPPTITPGGTDFCVPPYAWAAYEVCNYKYVKKFDMRGYGHWATELNGGSATAFRRFYNAYYGDPKVSANLTPGSNITTNCKGVRFMGFSSQSSLECICPSWMTPVKCLMLKFKTVPRPCQEPGSCGYNCATAFRDMDDNNMWDKEYTVQLCSTISCFFTGTVGTTPWTVDLHYQNAYTFDQCFWGPDVFDPCNPCDGLGKFTLSILSGDKIADCAGAGVLSSSITDIAMKDLVTNCVSKKPSGIKLCNSCHNAANQTLNLVVPDSVELSCCSPKNLGTCP